jgi:hypothetical protein
LAENITSKRVTKAKEDVLCWDCLKTGHISRDCVNPATLRRKTFKEAAKKKWRKKNRPEEHATDQAAWAYWSSHDGYGG